MHQATVFSKKPLNEQVIEFKLRTEKLHSTPGERIFILYPQEEWFLKRAYSIADEEIEGEYSILTFLIKIIPEGKGSQYLEKIKVWDELMIEWPHGHFRLKDTDNPRVFISTGSGLAPNYRMAKADTSDVEKWFFFSVPYEKDLFYLEEMRNLNIKHTAIHLSREEVEWFEKGRIDISEIDFPLETEFYICGLPQMVKDFLSQLKARGYKNIYFEAY